MKIFNTYENALMYGDIYVKLNDETFLFVGSDWIDEDFATSFTPASNNQDAHNRIYVRSADNGVFERRPDMDGLEIDIAKKYHKTIIRITFSGVKK